MAVGGGGADDAEGADNPLGIDSIGEKTGFECTLSSAEYEIDRFKKNKWKERGASGKDAGQYPNQKDND